METQGENLLNYVMMEITQMELDVTQTVCLRCLNGTAQEDLIQLTMYVCQNTEMVLLLEANNVMTVIQQTMTVAHL